MIDLAKEMKNLVMFVHISTAYCHLKEKVSVIFLSFAYLDSQKILNEPRQVLRERTYPPPADPHKVINCVEWMDDDVVEAMTDKILGDLPNTYAFTKALSESIVEESMSQIPSVILRYQQERLVQIHRC